jgi:hypothetical protein
MGPEQFTVTVLPLPLVLSPMLYVSFAAILVGGGEMGQLEAVLTQRRSRSIQRGQKNKKWTYKQESIQTAALPT